MLIRQKLYIQVNACAKALSFVLFLVHSTFDLIHWIEMLDFSLVEGQPAETARLSDPCFAFSIDLSQSNGPDFF